MIPTFRAKISSHKQTCMKATLKCTLLPMPIGSSEKCLVSFHAHLNLSARISFLIVFRSSSVRCSLWSSGMNLPSFYPSLMKISIRQLKNCFRRLLRRTCQQKSHRKKLNFRTCRPMQFSASSALQYSQAATRRLFRHSIQFTILCRSRQRRIST